MKRVTDNRVAVEAWNVTAPKTEDNPEGRVVIAKVAIRNRLGQFHGATNFKGSRIG